MEQVQKVEKTSNFDELYITKKAAALVVKKEAEVSRALSFAGIVSNFLLAVAAYANVIFGIVSAAFTTAIFGWYLYKCHQRVKNLKATYGL